MLASLPTAATDFYATQQRVSQVAEAEVLRHWRRMTPSFRTSWLTVGPPIVATVAEAQATMAEKAAAYVPLVLSQLGLPDNPVGEFIPSSLVGIASDGRPLDTLAYGAVAKALQAVADGYAPTEALAVARDWLSLMVKLQVGDAARVAAGVATATRREVSNYVRVLNPPSCQRCAILAGRVYRWSTGFDRHPRCDCVMMPVKNRDWAVAEGFVADPMDAYRRGEIRDLTQAQRDAIDDGADIFRVVNAHRGMSTTVTRRKPKPSQESPRLAPNFRPVVTPGMPDLLAGIRRPDLPGPRGLLTPEGIYRQARGDRAKALALLREWGYIE